MLGAAVASYAAAVTTLSKSAKSSYCTLSIPGFGRLLVFIKLFSLRIFSIASSPAYTRRLVIITLHPRRASTRAVSRPRPQFPPVTTAVLPVRSCPSDTSNAVLLNPNFYFCTDMVKRFGIVVGG